MGDNLKAVTGVRILRSWGLTDSKCLEEIGTEQERVGSCLVKCITLLRQAERSFLFVFSFLLWCTLNSVDLSEACLKYKCRDV